MIFDAVAGPPGLIGTTWAGTLVQPDRGLFSGFEVAGSSFAGAGSLLLLFESSQLSVSMIVLKLVAAGALVYNR